MDKCMQLKCNAGGAYAQYGIYGDPKDQVVGKHGIEDGITIIGTRNRNSYDTELSALRFR